MGCFICGQDNPAVLQEHHVVPQRFGGSDADENLTTLCASCHQAVEKMYNKRFYTELGVEKGEGDGSAAGDLVAGLVKHAQKEEEIIEEKFGEVPEWSDKDRLGHGETAGHHMVFKEACETVIDCIDTMFDGVDADEIRREINETENVAESVGEQELSSESAD